jgi:molybdopterin-guanine dinucleotide biosynthesis protein B
MRIFGLVGWSSSGKTTLVVRLLPELVGRGLLVSTAKHAHHGFDIDAPGKDSYEHRVAGAHQVIVSSARRWALIHEHRGAPELDFDSVLGHLERVDLVLVEGFKRHAHDKLEVHRAALGKPLLASDDAHIVAVAADAALPELALPVLDLDDTRAIADFIVAHCGLEARTGAATGEYIAAGRSP